MSEGSLLGSKLGSVLGVLDGFELGSSVALPINRGKSMGLLSTQLLPSVYCPSLLGHTRGLLYVGASAYSGQGERLELPLCPTPAVLSQG